jgi:nicotinamide-nucleotide amidase
MFPEGAEPIPNRRGTAPGIYLELPRPGRMPCKIVAMPGVPSEMKVMFHDDVLPRIKPRSAGLVIRSARINCFGLGESAAEELLGDVTARGRDPEVGITVHEATITLRIVASAGSAAEALKKIDATKKVIYERMGEYAYGEDDDELEHVAVRLLHERAQTLSVVESATGGLLAHRVTSVPGYEGCFHGSLVVAGSGSARELLGASAGSLGGAAIVRELAASCRKHLGADWGLAIGECSRTGDSETASDAPLVCIALAGQDGARAFDLNVAGDPAILKSRVAKSALNMLRLKLLK